MSPRSWIIAASVVLTLWSAVLLAGTAMTRTLRLEVVPAQQVQEDDPAWDCGTMGNRICGPVR